VPHRRGLSLAEFDYQLPPELIAQRPSPERGGSRLLVVPGADRPLEDRRFTDLPTFVAPGDLLVVNSSRVRRARFLGTRPSGAPAEVLLIHPEQGDRWVALGRPGSALQPGKRIGIGPEVAIETVQVLDDGHRLVRFLGASAEEAIRQFGRLPLPPYIDRAPDQLDDDRYQTIYADREGSVAAPTAGLHFTPSLLATLHTAGVRLGMLDLEVGPGTFKPVEVDDLADHPMHAERFEVPEALVQAVKEVKVAGGAVWAVGTTAVRALESAVDPKGRLQPGTGETRLFITPGYRFKVVDRMITNFHLPRSTLLMLVSAFAGTGRIQAAYRHAVAERYRFYSYGDAMLLLPD
jgi:S-adenosylmethionine:tRNA ribosyltransferase-isomerase